MAVDIGTGMDPPSPCHVDTKASLCHASIEVNSDATATGVTGEAAAYQR